MSSKPTAMLRNTCAGILELHSFRFYVSILAMNDLKGEGELLALIFGEVEPEMKGALSSPTEQSRRDDAGFTYGKRS